MSEALVGEAFQDFTPFLAEQSLGLAGARLTIGHKCSIEAFNKFVDHGQARPIKHIIVWGILIEYILKRKRLDSDIFRLALDIQPLVSVNIWVVIE